MDELYGYRSFADSRSHPFDRTMPHIAHGKETGNIGLEQKGVPFQRPSLGALAVSYKIGTSQDKSAFIPLNQIGQPIGSWQRSDKDEH